MVLPITLAGIMTKTSFKFATRQTLDNFIDYFPDIPLRIFMDTSTGEYWVSAKYGDPFKHDIIDEPTED